MRQWLRHYWYVLLLVVLVTLDVLLLFLPHLQP